MALKAHRMLLAHEDTTFHGAVVASIAIPWGKAKTDANNLIPCVEEQEPSSTKIGVSYLDIEIATPGRGEIFGSML